MYAENSNMYRFIFVLIHEVVRFENRFCTKFSSIRLPNVLHQLALKKLSGTYFNKALQRSLAKARERRGHLSDAGYGSRVSAGSNIASAVMARQGLFGITGPGRRKRRNSARESNGINTQMFLQYTQNTF
ncbi:uncharacterized protein LOC123537401 isoform X1 [Mercenaria mercenaria]|uniref:uncharacterized protein LOC123537401 isoform X1 n=1 Tax=Mercenaria mercenaria TaxID=6596 RepID=UPI00234EEBCC|nr:uncharacterized protein LOC123537401 isoform X1 [Mercenaria mercenaria]